MYEKHFLLWIKGTLQTLVNCMLESLGGFAPQTLIMHFFKTLTYFVFSHLRHCHYSICNCNKKGKKYNNQKICEHRWDWENVKGPSRFLRQADLRSSNLVLNAELARD